MASLRPSPGGSDGEGDAARTRAAHRYGLVLLLLLFTFMFLECGLTASWSIPVTVALQGGTFVAVLAAAETPRTLQRLALLIASVCTLISLFAIPSGGRAWVAAAAILSGLLVVAGPIAIARSIIRRGVIDVRTVLGAICIYVLLGLFWAYVYTLLANVITGPFFAQQSHATSSEYVYFSFVTMTTVGYGDLTAAGTFARGCAVLEALLGQVYLVTIVAVLVSNLGVRGRPDDATDEQ